MHRKKTLKKLIFGLKKYRKKFIFFSKALTLYCFIKIFVIKNFLNKKPDGATKETFIKFESLYIKMLDEFKVLISSSKLNILPNRKQI